MNTDILGHSITFESGDTVFSPGAVDTGTLAMLRAAALSPDHPEKVLDLGCGWGPVGIYCALLFGGENVSMLDVDPQAVECARRNCAANGVTPANLIVSDAYDALDDAGFTLILSNPPYHTDFAVAKKFIEKGFNRLAVGGRMMMVTKRKDWYKNKLISVFGGVKIEESDGYFIFTAVKKSAEYAAHKPKKTPPTPANEKRRHAPRH